MEIQIDGVVEIPETENYDTFYAAFIEWVESRGYSFGGGVNELDKDGKIA